MAQSLRFTVEVAADQATQALNAVSAALNTAGIQGSASLRGIGPAAKLAAADVSGATQSISKFKEGLSRSREAAMFFSASLGEFGPAGRTAQFALSGIAGAVLGGGGVLLALEGLRVAVRLGVDAWKAHAEEAKKTKEELAKITAEAKAAITQLDILKAKRAGDEVGAVRIEGSAAVAQARQAYVDARRALSAYIKEEGVLVDSSGRVVQATEVQFQKIEALRKAITKAAADLQAAHLRAGMAATEAQDKTDKKGEDDRDKANREALDRAHSTDTSGLPTVASFYDLESGGYNEADVAKAAEAVRKFEAEVLRAAHANTEAAGSVADFFSLESEGYDPAEIARNATVRAAKEQAEYNAEVERSAALAQQWGASIGSALGAVATGQQEIGAAVAQVGQQIVSMVVQNAIKQITANAYVAGSEGLKSQAGIPVVGPVLAISAMGAMISAALGLLGSLPSAAKGWANTGDYEGLMYVHKREAVLDEQTANDWRAGRSGGGGGNVTLAISAVDASGFQRVLRNSESELSKELRRLRRKRRG